MNVRRALEWGGGYPVATAAVVLVVGACLPFRGDLSVQTFMLLLVPVVLMVARFSGARASAYASVLSVLLLDLLFVPPYYQLRVASPSEWIGLAVFLTVALLAGQQTGQLRDRERAALQRQRELALINRLSFNLVSGKSIANTSALTVTQITTALAASRGALYARSTTGGCELLAEDGDAASPDEKEFVAWVIRSDKAIGLPPTVAASPEPRPVSVTPDAALEGRVADGVYLPLQTASGLEGVLYARLDAAEDGPADEDIRFLILVANLAGAALEHDRLEHEAAQLTLERQAESLKNTIVSSVSHELKTPLAAATARVTSLLEEDGDLDTAHVRSELGSVTRELERLDNSIRDLLDVSRLESDSWQARPEAYEVPEILGTVRSQLRPLHRERVGFDLPEDLPYVWVDFAQTVSAMGNLVENALAYSPSGSPVKVSARSIGATVEVVVEDEGPGVPDEEKESIFKKFYRGSASTAAPGGTGLGLAIAREIANSQGGSIRVEDAEPRGARFVLALPVAVIGAESE